MRRHRRRHVADTKVRRLCANETLHSGLLTACEALLFQAPAHACEHAGCGQAFRTLEQLREHTSTHTGQKAFQVISGSLRIPSGTVFNTARVASTLSLLSLCVCVCSCSVVSVRKASTASAWYSRLRTVPSCCVVFIGQVCFRSQLRVHERKHEMAAEEVTLSRLALSLPG